MLALTVREKLSTWDALRVEKISWSSISVFIGLCTALILLPIMAKLFLMGVAKFHRQDLKLQANPHGSIYDKLLNESEEPMRRRSHRMHRFISVGSNDVD